MAHIRARSIWLALPRAAIVRRNGEEASMTFRDTPTLHALLVRRLARRRLLGGGIQLAAATLLSGACSAQYDAPVSSTMPPIGPSKADAAVVPDCYRSQVLLSWGDPMFADAPALDPYLVNSGLLLTPEAA